VHFAGTKVMTSSDNPRWKWFRDGLEGLTTFAVLVDLIRIGGQVE
jgi:hypothetical protein